MILQKPHPEAVSPRVYGRVTGLLLITFALQVFLVAVSPSPVHADTVTLRNGKSLEGKVIDDGDPIVLELPGGGTVRLPRSQVASVESGPSPAEVLAAKEAGVPAGDAGALYDLVEWCKKSSLDKDATRLAWRVIEMDPDHLGAREELGFRRLGALWLTEADFRRTRGELLYEGKWVTKAEWRELERKAHTEMKMKEAERLFRKAAGEDPLAERQDALDALRDRPKSLRAWAVVRGSESLRWRERQFAARELAALGDRRYGRLLTHMAVTDGKRSVRDEALRTLKEWDDPDTVLSFIPHLDSANEARRINAVRAINVFSDRRAVGPMITTLSKVIGGFGRVHFAQLTQRAYVKDYELVSGGTGLVVQEVADPVVDTFVEGIILDIHIKRVEIVERIMTLRKMTGQNFGGKIDKWRQWWAQQIGSQQKKAAASS